MGFFSLFASISLLIYLLSPNINTAHATPAIVNPSPASATTIVEEACSAPYVHIYNSSGNAYCFAGDGYLGLHPDIYNSREWKGFH
jgi:hypothetical protein